MAFPARARVRKGANAQRGAALFVSLIMIFMLSIMGISAMRSASFERRMATNAVQSATTLQAAESATEQMLNDTAVLRRAAQNRLAVQEVDVTPVQAGKGIETDAEIVYIGDGPAFGFSSDFMTLRMVAQGEADIAGARTRSIVRQGARRVVPALQQ